MAAHENCHGKSYGKSRHGCRGKPWQLPSKLDRLAMAVSMVSNGSSTANSKPYSTPLQARRQTIASPTASHGKLYGTPWQAPRHATARSTSYKLEHLSSRVRSGPVGIRYQGGHLVALRRSNYVFEPCKWDQVRVGSGAMVGIRRLLRRVTSVSTPCEWDQGRVGSASGLIIAD